MASEAYHDWSGEAAGALLRVNSTLKLLLSQNFCNRCYRKFDRSEILSRRLYFLGNFIAERYFFLGNIIAARKFDRSRKISSTIDSRVCLPTLWRHPYIESLPTLWWLILYSGASLKGHPWNKATCMVNHDMWLSSNYINTYYSPPEIRTPH